MKNISQENYLDQLLNAVDGKTSGKKNETEILEDELVQAHKKSGFSGSSAEDDFIREFERELAEEGYEKYISEFEMELDSERNKERKPLREQENFGGSKIDESSMTEDSDDIDSVIQKITGDDFGGNGIDDLSMSDDISLNDETYIDNLSAADSNNGGGTIEEESIDLSQLENVLSKVEESPLFTEDGEIDLSGNGPKDLDDLLAEEDDYSDLSSLFAGEGQEESSEIDAFGAQQMEAAEIMISDESEEDGKGKKKKKKKKKSAEGEEGGLLKKLSKLFFAEPEADDTIDLNDTNDVSAKELSEENQQILMNLGEEPDNGKKKKEKKAKKEKAPKEKKEKKEKAPKPKKPPKPKKSKPVDLTPPLPKKPVFLIFLLIASMTAFVLFATNLIGYANSFNPAKELFKEGEYADAFELVGGKTPREEDELMHNQLRVLSAVQSEYKAYEVFFSMDMQQEALDSLVCAAGRYEVNYAGAEEYDCVEEMDAIKQKVEIALNVHYQTGFEEAQEIYSIRNRKEYSKKIMEKLQILGLD